MANTRDIRRRIKSVKNTAQITKAMQMVAASKMRKAQEAALQGRPYAKMLGAVIKAVSGDEEDAVHPLMEVRPVKNTAVLLITTDKGLCGALNTNLLRVVGTLSAGTKFVTLGRKGRAFVARTKRELLADFEQGDNLKFIEARKIGAYLTGLFTSGDVDKVDIHFTNYINTITQKPEVHTLLPLSKDYAVKSEGLGGESSHAEEAHALEKDYLFEPSSKLVLNALLPHAVNYEIWHCLLEAKASEHSARMVAMKNATDNAKQIIKDLTLEYNKVRQASITTEILEISSAAAAMG